ncbi:MAG: DUF2066 domain-containing protein [Halofilum sp. (in: g-proteobacteria)]|nr:DUF2066 domain-containing protein [Halofilum sp. (in: g-proteobacteria)]
MRLPVPVMLLLGAVLAAVALPGAAVTVDGLHNARVEVAGKGEEARTAGFRAALERVLVRISGSSAVASNPDVEPLLENAARYVQQYSYEALPEPEAGDGGADTGAETGTATAGDADATTGDAEAAGAADADADKPQTPTHRLVVTFAGAPIERALAERGIVVWGEQRPEVLLWLAVDDGRERYLVSADGDSEAYQLLSEVAARRGLPVVLPLLDMTDRQRIEFVDIRGGFFDAVRSASERYRAETLLVGYLERRDGRWAGDWNLLGLGDRRAWRVSGADLEAALTGGVGGTTERMAAALAGQGGERNSVHLRVRALGDLGAYARVARYLESLVRVRSAEVVGVRPDEAVFRLVIRGRVEELERTIALGNMLEAAPAAPTPSFGAAAPGSPEADAATDASAGGADRSEAATGDSDGAGTSAQAGGPATRTAARPARRAS